MSGIRWCSRGDRLRTAAQQETLDKLNERIARWAAEIAEWRAAQKAVSKDIRVQNGKAQV
jgi:uncharacterized coiled-coil protein SlyX